MKLCLKQCPLRLSPRQACQVFGRFRQACFLLAHEHGDLPIGFLGVGHQPIGNPR